MGMVRTISGARIRLGAEAQRTKHSLVRNTCLSFSAWLGQGHQYLTKQRRICSWQWGQLIWDYICGTRRALARLAMARILWEVLDLPAFVTVKGLGMALRKGGDN